jgi:putative ABC transport system permease protein
MFDRGLFYTTLKDTGRIFRRRPAVSALIVLTLALGIGANSALFSMVDTVLLSPLPFADSERLVRVETVRGGEGGLASIRELRDLKERLSDLFDGVAAYVPDSQYTLSGKGEAERLPAILVTHDFFDVLGVRLLHGAAWPEDFDRARNFGIILSNRVWKRKLSADQGVVGRTITLDASPSQNPAYTVYGVLPEGIDFPLKTELYRSLFVSKTFPNIEDRDARKVVIIARLKRGVALEAARERISNLAAELAREFPATNSGVGLAATPLRETFVGSVRPYLLLLLGAVALVLLIACANVTNLLLSAALEREREIAIRAALGAERGRIVRLLVGESILLSLAGGVVGLLFAAGAVRLLPSLVNVSFPAWMSFGLHARTLAFTFVLCLLTGVLAGLAPAVRTSAGRLPELLKEGGRGMGAGQRQGRLRALLAVSEVGLSLMLLIGASLMVHTFLWLWQSDLGFDPDRLLTFRSSLPWTYSPEQTSAFQHEVLERLSALPGVEGAAFNTNLPLSGSNQGGRGTVAAEGQGRDESSRNPYVNVQTVSPGYFRLMGIPLFKGRLLGSEDRQGAALWPGQVPLGKRLRRTDISGVEAPWLTVVGVVGDVKSGGPTSAAGPDLYVSWQQGTHRWLYYLLRTRQPSMNLGESVRRAVAAVDASQPIYDLATMRERLLETVWQQRLSGTLFGLFALLALALAAFGIYGVLSYSVEQRSLTTGIRMALGAQPSRILREVLSEALKLALCGVVAGLAGAAVLAWVLRSLLFGVSPLHAPTYLGVSVLLLGVACAAAYLPARRATHADPLEALRRP